MDTQKIQITESKNTIPALEVVNNPNRFLLLLDQHNIKDIADKQKINIQQDGDRYIVSLFDNNQENRFSVAGYNLTLFLTKFLTKQQENDENVVVRFAGMEGKELEVIRGTTEQISTLKQEILDHQAMATNPEAIKRRIGVLKDFFNNQKNDARRESFWGLAKYSRSRQERDYRRLHKGEADKRLKDLENIEKEMRRIERKGLSNDYYVNQELTDNEYKNLSQQLDKLSDNVPQFQLENQALRNGEADITPNYEIDISKLNKNQAKKLLKTIKDYNKKQTEVTSLTQKSGQEQMRARDLSALQDYLKQVINTNIDPTLIPFTAQHKDDFNYLLGLDSKLKNEFPGVAVETTINNENQGNIEGEIGTGNNNQQLENTNGINDNNKVLDENGNWVDAVGAGGFYGGINSATENRQDKSERGQNFYKSFGNIALLAGGIFLGVKAIKSTWNIIRGKGNSKDRGRLGGTAGLLLLTAGRPQDLFKGGYASEKFADILKMIGFSGGKENQSNSPMQAVEQSTTGAMTLFNGMKYEDMKKIIKPDSNGKMKLDPEYRDAQLAQAKAIASTGTGLDKANAEAKVKFLETIGKDDKRGLINLALISMGMNWAALNDSANAETPFNTGAEAYIQRTLALAELMNSKKYQKTNNESDTKIQEYMQGKIDLDELEASGAFEKIVTLPQDVKDALKGQVDALDITDPVKKQNLLEAIYQFYQDWNATDKSTFKIEKDANGNIIISTYGEKTPISLDKIIIGLPITFETTKETLRVANLTNKIKSLSRSLTPNKKPPFYLDITGEITFDNKKIYEIRKQDLTLISKEGLKDSSRKFSDKANKETYVNYLNGLGVRGGGENQNITEVIIPATIVTGSTDLDVTDDDIEENDSNIIEQEKLQKDLDKIDTLDISDVAKDKIKKDYTEFYKKYPSIKTIGVELIADGNTLNVKSYRKITPIDFNKNQVVGLNIDFGNFEDMFKTANLTNKIRSTFENITSKKTIDPFGQKTFNDDITFDDKSVRDWRPDVAAVSDGLWRGSLRTVSPKLAETSNKQLYIKYLNDLWLMQDKAEGFFPIIDQFSNFDTKQKIIDGFKSFYKNHPSEEKNIKFEKNNEETLLKTYEQSTPIDLISKKIIGLSLQFDTYEELFKVANLINKAKDVTIDKEIDGDEAFDITYLGALEFYGTQKTIRVFSEDGLTQNSEKFEERSNKRLLEDYLNKRWRDSHGQTNQEIPQQ